MRTSKLILGLFMVSLLVVLWSVQPIMAQMNGTAAKTNKPEMSKMGMTEAHYLIMIDHPSGDCETSMHGMMTNMMGMDPKDTKMEKRPMPMKEWGCSPDNRTGYVVAVASNETEALNMVPESDRANAKVIKLNNASWSAMKPMEKTGEMKEKSTKSTGY
jgi:hypothetical protein